RGGSSGGVGCQPRRRCPPRLFLCFFAGGLRSAVPLLRARLRFVSFFSGRLRYAVPLLRALLRFVSFCLPVQMTAPCCFNSAMSSQEYPLARRTSSVCWPCSGARRRDVSLCPSNCAGAVTTVRGGPGSSPGTR